MGYYAHSMDTEYKPLSTEDFDYDRHSNLQKLTWKISEAGK
jgi:hypothetical protein